MVEVIFALLALATIAELTFSIIFLQLYLQRKRVIYLYFTIFTGIAIFWSIGTALMLFSRTTSAVFLGYWFFLIAPMLSTLFILYFCQQFIKGKTSIGYFWGVVFIIIYAALLAINNNLLRIEFSVSGLNYLYPNRLFYLFYGLYFIIYFDISIFILRQHNQSSDRYKYFQAKSIVYATGLTGTLGIFTNIFLPAIGTPQYVWMGPIFSLIFLTFSAIAMTKYKLFDVRSTILRSTSYIFSVIILISLYSGVVVGIFGRTILNENGSVLQWFSLSLITALVAVAFTPLQKFFNKVSNKLFYRDAYDTQVFLNEFNQAIVSTIDLSKLLSKASDVVQKYIKSETVVFAIRDSQGDSLRLISDSRNDVSKESLEQIRAYVHKSSEKLFVTDTVEDSDGDLKHLLQEANVGLLARITTDVSVEGNGYIILGYKKSGNIYNSQDIGALEIITNELAIAMQNALQFDEIQRFNVTLQDTVDDKTKQLRKSNEKLKQMDETKDEFISMASHQLRTPLTSVKGYLSMVIEGDAGDLNEMQHKLLDQAFVSSQRMVYLIADLLNVSRLRTGKFIIEPIKTNLADVIQGEVDQLVETAESRGLELKFEKSKDFPELLLDETKIRQVIMNFIDNAIYYTPSGGHIKVSLEDKGKTIEYRVTDDGMGVPKAEQHHLFNKFYRAGNAKKARPDGTGLGLFMAKKVIVASGGSIIFKSQEGKGSTFGFSFSKDKILVPDDYEEPEPLNGIKVGPGASTE